MKVRIFTIFSILFLLAFTSIPMAFAENNSADNRVRHADIYDMFLMSWTSVDLDDPEVQWFVDRLPPQSELYRKPDTGPKRTYIFLSPSEFGCIAKDNLPLSAGDKMHIENCEIKRLVSDGMADTNYTYHERGHLDLYGEFIVDKNFNSTVTWSFNYLPDDDIWLVGRSKINDSGPDLVEFTCVEGEGIKNTRKANKITWQE